jgi:hypothetical protein
MLYERAIEGSEQVYTDLTRRYGQVSDLHHDIHLICYRMHALCPCVTSLIANTVISPGPSLRNEAPAARNAYSVLAESTPLHATFGHNDEHRACLPYAAVFVIGTSEAGGQGTDGYQLLSVKFLCEVWVPNKHAPDFDGAIKELKREFYTNWLASSPLNRAGWDDS